jgi:hypothetical protein
VASKSVTQRAIAAAIARIDEHASLPKAAVHRMTELLAKLSRGVLLPQLSHAFTLSDYAAEGSDASND